RRRAARRDLTRAGALRDPRDLPGRIAAAGRQQDRKREEDLAAGRFGGAGARASGGGVFGNAVKVGPYDVASPFGWGDTIDPHLCGEPQAWNIAISDIAVSRSRPSAWER